MKSSIRPTFVYSCSQIPHRASMLLQSPIAHDAALTPLSLNGINIKAFMKIVKCDVGESGFVEWNSRIMIGFTLHIKHRRRSFMLCHASLEVEFLWALEAWKLWVIV